jgi:hypothetical protein
VGAAGSVSAFPKVRRGWRPSAIPFVMPTDGKTATPPAGCGASTATVPGLRGQLRAPGLPGSLVPQSGLFMCPCHGGAYYRDGSRASGPPERGLFEYPYKVRERRAHHHAGELPTPGRRAARAEENRHARDREDREWLDLRCSWRRRFARLRNIPCRETRRAGGTSSAAPRSRLLLQL